MNKTSPWSDWGVIFIGIFVLATLAVSAQPTYVSLSLFHSVRDPIWSIVLTSFALFVLEGGALTSKALCIWIPKWDKQLTLFMFVFLLITFGANVVHGWQSFQDQFIEPNSIYAVIRSDGFLSILWTAAYAAMFPGTQGILAHGFVMRWRDVDTSISQLEMTRNELKQVETERDELGNQKKQDETKRNELEQIVSDLKQRILSMQEELEKRPIFVEETSYPIMKRNISLDQLTNRINLFLEDRNITIARSTLDRILKSISEMEEV